jgi:hypothetical protein
VIYTKHKSGRFPVRYEGPGYCSDSGYLHSEGRPVSHDDDGNEWFAVTLEEAKARAQLHFERRLDGREKAPSHEEACEVT